MRFLLLFVWAGLLPAADTVQAFGHKWSVPVGADWTVTKEGGEVLKMLVKRPQEKPRRPIQFALAETAPWQRVTVEAEVKPHGKSLIIIYAYRDEAHFNYAHLSEDQAEDVSFHNGIFHVYEGDRVRISPQRGPASFDGPNKWYPVRLTYDAATGIVEVRVNGRTNVALSAVDLSLGAGKVGLGSFFDTAEFRNVKISGLPARTASEPEPMPAATEQPVTK